MKIISWNCCGKFRSKFEKIAEYDADIYIIQECENPRTCNDSGYKSFSSNSVWIGHNPNRGLGVFWKDTIHINDNHWESYCLRHFLSLNVNDVFNLVAVWACKHTSRNTISISVSIEKNSPNVTFLYSGTSTATKSGIKITRTEFTASL